MNFCSFLFSKISIKNKEKNNLGNILNLANLFNYLKPAHIAGNFLCTKYVFFLSFIIFLSFPYLTIAATPNIIGCKLNSQSSDVTFNPNTSSIDIEISADQPVKFSTIAICEESDSICSRTTAVRYFTNTSSYLNSITKSWNGKDGSSNTAVLVPSGVYKIKNTITNEPNEKGDDQICNAKIIVDYSGSSSETNNNSNETSTSTTATATSTASTTSSSTTTTQTVYKYISVHTNPEDLSNYEEPTVLEVSAGRNRVSYVGIPIEFAAKIKATGYLLGQNKKVTWSFGDGTSDVGENVEHIYKNTGDYNVVINVKVGDKTSVSRGTVKILESQVSLVQFNDNNFTIKNLGNYEINLNNWSVGSGDFYFTFPLDTILSAGQSLVVSSEYSKLKTNDNNQVVLLDPSKTQKSALVNNKNNSELAEGNFTSDEITEINNAIATYRTRRAKQNDEMTMENKTSEAVSLPSTFQNLGQIKAQTQTASAIEAFSDNIKDSASEEESEELLSSGDQFNEISTSTSLVSKIIHWPVKVVDSFVDLFYPGLNSKTAD